MSPEPTPEPEAATVDASYVASLKSRKADLETIIKKLPKRSPILERKKKQLKTVEAELEALAAK